MKLELNKHFTTLDGQTGDVELGKLLAAELMGESSNIDTLKAYDWATALYKTGIIEVDRTDADLLEKFVRSKNCFKNCRLSNGASIQVLVQGQILQIIRKFIAKKNKE